MLRCPHLLTLAALACGGSDTPRHATPTGWVAGVVTDALTRKPLQRASVAAWDGESVRTAVTDQEGDFKITGLPAGSTLWIDVTTDGYAVQRYMVTLDDAAGQEPQSNSFQILDVWLWPTQADDGTMEPRPFAFRITLHAGGDRIPGREVYLIDGHPLATGPLPGGVSVSLPERIAATTDDQGEAKLPDPMAGGAGVAYGATYTLGVEPFPHAGKTWWKSMSVTHNPDNTLNSIDVEADELLSGTGGGTESEAEAESESESEAESESESESEGEVCNASNATCCVNTMPNPCGYGGGDGFCDCPGCTWEGTDCPSR